MEAWLCRAPLGRTMIIEAAFSFTSCRSCSGVHEHVDSDYHHHDGDNDLFALFTTTGGTKAKVSSPPIPLSCPLLQPNSSPTGSRFFFLLFAPRISIFYEPARKLLTDTSYHSFCLTVISARPENEVLVRLCPSCDPHSYDCIIHSSHSEDCKRGTGSSVRLLIWC